MVGSEMWRDKTGHGRSGDLRDMARCRMGRKTAWRIVGQPQDMRQRVWKKALLYFMTHGKARHTLVAEKV